MGGVTAEKPLLPYEQDSWRLATTISRDVVEGDALIRHASEVDAADLSSGPTDAVQFLGIAGEEYGGSASATTTQPAGIDARPYVALWGRNVKTRIQDSATVAYDAALTLSSTTAGALVTATAGQPVVGICKKAITSGAVGQFTACDIFPAGGAQPLASGAGTASTGVTAVESFSGFYHRTTLTVAGTLPAIAGGAALAVGLSLYTFPAGVIHVHGSHMSLSITQTEGNITADTPDGGLGTTIGSGANALLSAVGAGAENILTGQTFDDCNGTAETIAVGTDLAINAADSHIVYFNVADTWAGSGDAGAALAGTVVLLWSALT